MLNIKNQKSKIWKRKNIFPFPENKYSTHIRNGIVISILFIITVLIIKLTSLNYGLLYIFVIISIYWIGYIHTQPVYKMPYIYMFYTALMKVTGKTKEANAKYNVEKNITLKVEEKSIYSKK